VSFLTSSSHIVYARCITLINVILHIFIVRLISRLIYVSLGFGRAIFHYFPLFIPCRVSLSHSHALLKYFGDFKDLVDKDVSYHYSDVSEWDQSFENTWWSDWTGMITILILNYNQHTYTSSVSNYCSSFHNTSNIRLSLEFSTP